MERRFGALLAVVALLAPTWAGLRLVHGEEVRDLPNVVIFLIDTLRADRLGGYGYPVATSPNIDALAREGVLFRQAHGAAPWTLPSIVSLLTSTFPCEHRILADGQKLSSKQEPLAERLKRIGYRTAAFYANPYAGKISGLRRGYDSSRQRQQTGGLIVWQWLETEDPRNFFLYIHNGEPHNPYLKRQQWMRIFGGVSKAVSRSLGLETRQLRRLTRWDFRNRVPIGTTDNSKAQRRLIGNLDRRRGDYSILYDGSVRLADSRVGEVLDVLRQRGILDETLFILLSDHGEEFGEHGGWLHDQSVYEELIRVPMVLRFPGRQFAGRIVGEPVSLVDVLPTIADFLRRPRIASAARGRSLMPLIRGEASEASAGSGILAMRLNKKKYYRPFKESRGDKNVLVRHGQWKGIWNAEVGTLELYDLRRDPGETDDRAAENKALSDSMKKKAASWLTTCESPWEETVPLVAPELDKESEAALRALGYID